MVINSKLLGKVSLDQSGGRTDVYELSTYITYSIFNIKKNGLNQMLQ